MAVLPSGLTMTVASSESVSLSNGGDPLSVTGLVDTTTINGGSGNPNGSTFASVYNASTLTWTSYSAATPARVGVSTIDTHGHVVSSQAGGFTPVTYGYDAAGRLTNVAQCTRTSSIAYGADGLPMSFTDSLSRTTSVARDPVGRPLAWTLPDGRIVQMTYDANGNVASVTPPGRPIYDMTYTPVDLLETFLPPATPDAPAALTHYAYNTAKQITTVSLPDGEAIQYHYDTPGRIHDLEYPDDEVVFGYDPTYGYLSSMTSSAGTLTVVNDGPLLKGMSWAGEVSGNVAYSYDSQLRLQSDSVNGDGPLARTYDPDGLLTQVGALAVGRDAVSGLVTGTAIGSVSDSIGYNSFGEPTTYAATAGSTSIYGVSYVRDALGRITQKTETNGGSSYAWGYAYDATGRLTDVTLGGAAYAHYDFDANGNRLDRVAPDGTETATYDAQDRVETYQDARYTLTANGALASRIDRLGTTTYGYDAVGNLRHVSLPDGRAIDYVIDGSNRRIGKKINGVLVQAFLYGGGLGPIAELDGSGNVVSRFVYAGGGNVPEYMVKGGETYRLVKDQLGSPRAVVDVATGLVAQRMDFDEYGRVLNDSAPGAQPFGFAGGLWDRDVGLVRFGERDFDPTGGRWTVKDPLGFAGGSAALYQYCANDPVNCIDPSGRWGEGLGYWLVAHSDFFEGWSLYGANVAEGVAVGTAGTVVALGLAAELAPAYAVSTAGAALNAAWASAATACGIGAAGAASTPLAIQFGGNANQIYNAWRHIDDAGLARGDVQAAIENDLQTTAAGLSPGTAIYPFVDVAGQTLQYTAYMLRNGTVNVGRITVIP